MTAPALSDILRVAEHKGWPARTVGRLTVGPGERDWRRVGPRLSYEERGAIWESFQSHSQLQTRGVGPNVSDERAADNSEQPSGREIRVFFEAVRAAQAHGLILSRCRLGWFDKEGDPGVVDGYFDPTADPPEVWIARGMPEGQLFATVVHELAHAHDLATLGRERYRALTQEERERRARAFEARVLIAEGLSSLCL